MTNQSLFLMLLALWHRGVITSPALIRNWGPSRDSAPNERCAILGHNRIYRIFQAEIWVKNELS